MLRLRRHLAPVIAVAAACFYLGCGGDGIVLPDEGDPAAIDIVDGNEQIGPAGGTLVEPLVVRVTDSRGRPVESQDVVFSPGAGAGSVSPETVKTDAGGRASTAWTLGPGAGAQLVEARAEGGTAPDDLATTFSATALAGAAAAIELVSGNEQTGAVGSALPDSLVVKVTDGDGNPVADVAVTWSVSGGGSVSPVTVPSGPDGLAAAERVLGPGSGEQTTEASATGVNGSVSFTHTAVPANPTGLVLVSGDGQSAPAGFQLPDSLVVRLVDPNGNGVGGRSVTWVVGAGEGTVDPVNSTTTPQGFAITRWTMPATAGSYSIDAVFSGLQPVGFGATATADAPTTLALQSGDNQSAVVGGTLPQPLRVKVTDGLGNPVENVSVTWTANGGGSVGSTTTGTNAQGIAEVTRTLGIVPGPYTTTAAVNGLQGSPVTFNSTATVGPPFKLAIVTQPSPTAESGVPLAQQPVIQLQDLLGNNVAVSGRGITASVGAGGSVTSANATTDATGKATFTALAITGPAGSTFKVTFNSGTLLPVVSEDVVIGAGSAAKLAIAVAPSSTVEAGVAFPDQPVIQIQDGAGNPVAVAGVNVTVDISSGGGTLNGIKTKVSDDNGKATFSGLSISGLVGLRTLRFRAPTLTQVTAPVTVVAGPAFQIDAESDINQDGTPGQTVADPPSVHVRDASDNPVQGIQVTFAVATGGGEIAPDDPVTTGADGIAALTSWTLGPAVGANTVTATAGTLSGSPVTFTATAGALPTSTNVTSSSNPSVFGQQVTFTVAVTSGSGTPDGSVTLEVDGSPGPTGVLSGGQATFNISDLPVGNHSIGATYPGSGTFGASSDDTPVTQQVDKAATGTSLSSSGSPSTFGDPVTFTATVSVGGPGAGTATGQVNFLDNGAVIGNGTLSGGTATFTTTTLTEGDHPITAEYVGDGSFEGSTSGQVTQHIDPAPNEPPSTVGDTYGVSEDGTLTPDPGGGVLANDSDPEDDPLTAAQVAGPAHAQSFSLNSDGSFSYQPVSDYNGPDGFTYRASDGSGTSEITTVTITVLPVNDAPVATADNGGTSLLGSVVSQDPPGVLANDTDVDGDPLTAVLDDDVDNGTLTLSSDGSFTYTPDSGFTGVDSFQYHASDGATSSGSVTVSLQVVLSL